VYLVKLPCYTDWRGNTMTTKEKVITESISRIKRELDGIDEILNANPLSEIIKLRQKAAEITEGEKWRDKSVLAELNEMGKEEKRLFALAKKQQNTNELIDRKVKLEMELSDLNSELYFINYRKKANANSV